MFASGRMLSSESQLEHSDKSEDEFRDSVDRNPSSSRDRATPSYRASNGLTSSARNHEILSAFESDVESESDLDSHPDIDPHPQYSATCFGIRYNEKTTRIQLPRPDEGKNARVLGQCLIIDCARVVYMELCQCASISNQRVPSCYTLCGNALRSHYRNDHSSTRREHASLHVPS